MFKPMRKGSEVSLTVVGISCGHITIGLLGVCGLWVSSVGPISGSRTLCGFGLLGIACERAVARLIPGGGCSLG